jgi:pimeloyl-ACP methyl ester carboxylesterase
MLEKKRAVPDELLLDTLFTQSLASQTAGRAFLKRIRARTIDRDSDVTAAAAGRQELALAGWGAPHPDSTSYLSQIKQPVLLVDGSNDVVFYTANAIELQKALPNAQLIIYPDSNHGAQYQYPALFLAHLRIFLLSTEGKSAQCCLF